MDTDRSTAAQDWTPTTSERRSLKNGRNCAIWAFVFAASFLAGRYIFVDRGLFPEGALGIALSLLPMIPGWLAFSAFLKLYRESDEILRKTLTEGLIFGMGVAVIFWGAIQLPEHVWLTKISADKLMAVMLFAFSFGVIRATWRYR